MPSLAGETALVTGAKGGLGSAIADELHDQGAQVFGISRNRKDAEFIASKFGTSPVVLDVSDTQSIRNSLESLWET